MIELILATPKCFAFDCKEPESIIQVLLAFAILFLAFYLTRRWWRGR
jgi:hypothetical protein